MAKKAFTTEVEADIPLGESGAVLAVTGEYAFVPKGPVEDIFDTDAESVDITEVQLIEDGLRDDVTTLVIYILREFDDVKLVHHLLMPLLEEGRRLHSIPEPDDSQEDR